MITAIGSTKQRNVINADVYHDQNYNGLDKVIEKRINCPSPGLKQEQQQRV